MRQRAPRSPQEARRSSLV